MEKKILLMILASLYLFSCQTVKQGLGIEKNSPDEFAIDKSNEIVLPPDYNLLPPDSKRAEEITKEKNLDLIIKQEIINKKVNENEEQPKVKSEKFKKSNIENQLLNKIN